MPKTYLLTGVDDELFMKFKVFCAYSGESMKDVLITYMMSAVQDFNFDLFLNDTDRFKS